MHGEGTHKRLNETEVSLRLLCWKGSYPLSARILLWGETEDGNLILSDDNVTLIEHGTREWWVQVKTASGKTGWVLDSDNFDGMDALAETPMKTIQVRESL